MAEINIFFRYFLPDWPTPNFSIFIRSFACSFALSFVSLDQILVLTHSFRDKGTKGHKDKGTKGQRDKETKGQKDKGTKGQKNLGTLRLGDFGTWKLWIF